MAALLVDRLPPAAPTAPGALGAGPELATRWLTDAADAAAAGLAQPQLLAAEPGAAALLGALLAGHGAERQLPLLRPAAATACLQQLHGHLQSALNHPGA